ncbi:endogenous retrovirus group K3 member 1 isoform X3 [Strix uralensis]|uniref:endogenous retrovirus group K3 member 1 isoform X3 n=1 Tax=Strix uralensis TaxID=36305 RepID=UPI003DA57D28
MKLCKQVVISWELAYSVAAFALGNAPPSTNWSEFVMIQHIVLIPAGPRLVSGALCEPYRTLKKTAACSYAKEENGVQTTVVIYLETGGGARGLAPQQMPGPLGAIPKYSTARPKDSPAPSNKAGLDLLITTELILKEPDVTYLASTRVYAPLPLGMELGDCSYHLGKSKTTTTKSRRHDDMGRSDANSRKYLSCLFGPHFNQLGVFKAENPSVWHC